MSIPLAQNNWCNKWGCYTQTQRQGKSNSKPPYKKIHLGNWGNKWDVTVNLNAKETDIL